MRCQITYISIHIIFFILSLNGLAQTSIYTGSQNNFRVMFYNTENFFDTFHDSLKQDTEFLPNSVRGWNYGRYKQKIRNISKVIVAVGEWSPPVLIGMCEVENERVMKDLTLYSSLKELGYRYIMTDSPDQRGIDVALLYQPENFRLLNSRSIRINFPDKEERPTRDILHVSGLIASYDTLDVFVVHLPSRSGGEKESEPKRLYAVSLLKLQVDSILHNRLSPKVLIMGDFNDYPENASITKILGAKAPVDSIFSLSLYNLMADKKKKNYKYRGEWGTLDQLIVSGSLLSNTDGFHTSSDRARVCDFPFLLEEDSKYGGFCPYRTYYGMKYVGGYSDHLPVAIDFVFPITN